jgi:membrane protease YdiL (CAAX protease family)
MIGRAFRNDRRRGAIALVLALVIVALQFKGAVLDRRWVEAQHGAHLAVVLGAIVALWWLAGRDLDTLGLRLHVDPTWRYWTIAIALIALAVGAIIAGYLVAIGAHDELSFTAPDASTWLVDVPDAAIYWPVLEELVFRVALCSALVAWIGTWPTVFASGAIFAAVHFVYGNPSPDNFVAGYFMAWAYLRSGSVAVPLAMHAGGNLIIVLLRPTF